MTSGFYCSCFSHFSVFLFRSKDEHILYFWFVILLAACNFAFFFQRPQVCFTIMTLGLFFRPGCLFSSLSRLPCIFITHHHYDLLYFQVKQKQDTVSFDSSVYFFEAFSRHSGFLEGLECILGAIDGEAG